MEFCANKGKGGKLLAPFRNYLPLKKGGALHMNKFENPLHKNALCHVSLKLAQCFWRRRFFNFVNVFRNYLPLENLNLFYLRMYCAKFGGNWPSGSEEKDENVKNYDLANANNIKGQRTNLDQKNSLEPWAQVN